MRVRGAHWRVAILVAIVGLATGAVALVLARSDAKADDKDAGPGPITWDSTTTSFHIDGRDRSFLTVRPQVRKHTQLPVVVVLHGRNATPELERTRTDFPAAMGPAIYVYPAGFEQSWNAGSCCAGAEAAGIDDVGFLTDVVHRVETSQTDVDRKRVVLVGFSNGGRMAYRLTCAEPSLFSAYAVIGAVPVWDCGHRPALPFTDVAYDHDPLVPFIGATEQAATQRAANRCAATATTVARGNATVTTWSSCQSGGPVQLVVYPGDKHVWPTGGPGTPSAEQLVTDFFRTIGAAQAT